MAKSSIFTSSTGKFLSAAELNALADRLANHADGIVNVAAHEMEANRNRPLISYVYF